MKALAAAALGVLVVLVGQPSGKEAAWRVEAPETPALVLGAPAVHAAAARGIAPEDLAAVVQRYCQVCHNDNLLTAGLSLEGFDVANPMARAQTAEKMIQKLRLGMMPPPGMPRPGGDTLMALVEELEQRLDEAAVASPTPGVLSFHRLTRPEYENSIRDLLGLEVDASEFLPPDTKSDNFDNNVDTQLMSPMLVDAYLRAASEISRTAVGNPDAVPRQSLYWVPQDASQADHVRGAPIGTRGGISVIHNFPADGEYYFHLGLLTVAQSALHTAEKPDEIEVSIDGERVLLLVVDRRWQITGNPDDGAPIDGVRTEPVFIRAGPRRVSVAFINRYEGPLADLISPNDYTQSVLSSTGYGIQLINHLRDFAIVGPFNITGVSETPIRQRIFTCRPTSSGEAVPCARQILSRLATAAFRRPVTPEELEALTSFYEQGEAEGGFEVGIWTGLEAILASPRFTFRFEKQAGTGRAAESYRISDFDLASRLSYFLWATSPDEELLSLARQGKLSDRRVLEGQVRRMLEDSRSEALATRFASQWLRLSDVDLVVPDMYVFPDFHRQLGDAMQRETELFFYNLVQNDRSVLEMFTADYTFLNEQLAKHYGIPEIAGEGFRQVQYPDERRRGLFGHGSIHLLTSIATRTSPVLRGKWVMEVILGAPPPPPPPGIPALEETASTVEGRPLTTRERMEIHRANPTCNACHRFMDPLGLALDNFDVVGKWRFRENRMLLDTRGELWDGTPVASPKELQDALLKRPLPLLRNFTVNLMTYALGRRVEYSDMPRIRRIVDTAAANDYRMSSFILGVVTSDAFLMRKAAVVTDGSNDTAVTPTL